MNSIRDLILSLQETSWFQALPPNLREPPGLWIVAGVILVLLFVASFFFLKLIGNVFFGAAKDGRKNLDGKVRRSMRRDLAEMKRQGNHRGAGELYESLGQSKQALAAYKRGGCHEERATLLTRLERRSEAKKVARSGGVWRLYAEICQEDGELEEAAIAFERDGQVYLAGRSYEQLGRKTAAARCFIAAGMEAQAVQLLEDVEGVKAAELLDQALRSSLSATGPSGLSLELQRAVRRAVQLWLAAGEAEKAFRLAVDAAQLKLAIPVARDYLDPSVETAELCERAGATLVAADLWERLGETRRAALQRASHHQQRQEPEAAAAAFEAAGEWADAAEQWALAGNTQKAAELFAEGGDLHSAAQLFAQSGDAEKSQMLLSRAHAHSIEGRFESEATARFAGETLAAGIPSAQQPGGPPTATVPGVAPSEQTLADSPNPQVAAAPLETMPAADKNRYRLIDVIGRGGMGTVYRAEDRMLLREVAYKMVPEGVTNADFGPETLLAEARAAARLSHPNIVQVFDVGRQGAGFYIVMELVRGKNLEKLLQERRLSVRGAIQVGRQVCAALAHAHEKRIVHRDLKPSNLLLGEEQRIKLSDFGLARIFEANVGKVATQPAGTPSYMSPEQIRGEPLSPQTDLYAFGCVMWEMLCQSPVFGTGATSFHHHLSSAPQDPRDQRPDLPNLLAELVLECLSKDPQKRPKSAALIGSRLAEML